LNAALWIVQCLLAALFAMAGYGKLTQTIAQHVADGHLKPGDPVWPLRVLGVLELLGCVGILAPWFVGIAPILTPVAAVCFGLLMAGAFVVHARRREFRFLPLPMLVMAMAAFVAFHRFAAALAH
jgi:uncharacterized membrane protein YphA (DoxX/SURF4 family)